MDKEKVLVVDYHPLAHVGLTPAVRYAFPGSTVLSASSLSEAEEKLTKAGRIAMALLDPNLPDARGLSGLLRIQYKAPRVPVVLVLGRDDYGLAGTARGMGAAGAIFKSYAIDRIADLLREIAAGRRIFPVEAVPSNVRSIRDRLSGLSDAQRRVLFALADGRANKSIAYDLEHFHVERNRTGVPNQQIL